MSFIDLHSHVLPGLDDGVRSLADGLALIDALSKIGFGTICATPHQRADMFLPTSAAIDEAYATVRGALASDSPTLYLGAENFWDEVLAMRMPKGVQPAYTGNKAFLFEIPVAMWPPRLPDMLFDVRMRGMLPVMAHPERYQALWDAPERVEQLSRTTALVIDLGALDGAHGESEKEAARELVDEGFAHAAASDAHSLSDVARAAAGIEYIRKRHGAARVTKLLSEGPRRILAGEIPD